jgi:hypothetical protein
MMIQKLRKFCLCICVVSISLTTGCATNPGQSANSSWTDCGWGALLGAGTGAVIGAFNGGGTGALIGAGAGAVTGCAAGYILSKYLQPEEKKQYDANLNQQMKAMPVNATATDNWTSIDRTKTVNTKISDVIPLQQVSAQLGKTVNLNQSKMAALPQNTSCRASDAAFNVNGKPHSDKGVWCRDGQGDYIRVDGVAV